MQKATRDLPSRIPPSALCLGIAGLIPFIAIPVLVAIGADVWMPDTLKGIATIPALILYAAVILSFMGGVQWGNAIRLSDAEPATDFRRYAISVLPALLAWTATLLDARTGIAVLGVGFVVLLAYDIWTVRAGEMANWYETLRLGLTSVVVVSLTATSALLI